MNLNSEDVDFDFFDTPRESERVSPKSKPFSLDSKPPNAYRSKHDSDGKFTEQRSSGRNESVNDRRNEGGSKSRYSDDSFSDASSASDTPRNVKQRRAPVKNSAKGRYSKDDSSLSESSSAYSNSDYSSDEEDRSVERKKEKINVHMPKAQEAWSRNSEDFDDEKVDIKTAERENRDGKKSLSNYKNRPRSASSDSESDAKEYLRRNRIKSGKSRERQNSKDKRQRSLKSSGSFSNNSDITDVSPLGSNENSPRFPRRSNKNSKHNGQYDDVQYDSNSPERPADIKLETEEIDLSILMKCMADIDREKQERLKANTRRVMFAPPTVNENKKGNYTFSAGRAKMIEKENQRLLKQIMTQMHTGSGRRPEENKPKAPRRPKKATEPVVQRLTPSAVNRIREQRRIESENMVSKFL